MGAADGMKMGAAVPHIFQKIIPLYNNKADYVLCFFQLYLTIM